ncbi:MAG: fatty acid desaturase [Saprospiraceae bacterium]|nr:fatty acid desaturase [Saprospiraceae bacterium]
MQNNNLKDSLKDWRGMLKEYQKPNTKKAIVQLLNSFLPFLGLWVLMYFSLDWSYLITIALALITAFFLLRIFVIQHDCGHQSFLQFRKWNNAIGFISSFFSTIPFKYWSMMHDIHHAHNGQIEYRGLGDIKFLTTEEYDKRSNFWKMNYRIRRMPILQFFIIPIIYFCVAIRIPLLYTHLKKRKNIHWPHIINNLSMIVLYGILAFLLGWQKFLLVHIPIILFFGMISFWLFYIQHQHEENYKESKDNWDHLLASVRGSTYYKLPRMFQWLSGNIGFHHIHHLNSRIPNYHLEACANANPTLNSFTNILTFRESLKCIHSKLWDEQTQRMISFKEYNEIQR